MSRFGRLISRVCVLVIVFGNQAASYAADTETAAESFSVVLLPDTQYYSEKYPDTYVAQALWVRQQAKKDNIKFVVHLGDIVQTATQKREWENADRAMRLLMVSWPTVWHQAIMTWLSGTATQHCTTSTTRLSDSRTESGTAGTWEKPTTTTTASLRPVV